MIILVALARVGDVTSYSAMFGYLPKLLHNFGQEWTDIGFYQGVVLALYMTAYVFSSLAVGRLIDRYGSRTIFVICVFSQACVVCFASFTSSTTWLYISATLLGFSSAVNVVSKVIVYEISDDSNQAYVYNFALSMPCNCSLFLGPALGGILSFPTEQYPELFPSNTILASFPILLPNLLLSVMLFCLSLSAFIVFRYSETYSSDSIALEKTESSCFDNIEKKTYNKMNLVNFHMQPSVVVTNLIMIIYTLVTDGFQTLLGVWMQTPSILFGLGYSPRKSGLLMLISGSLLVVTDSLIVGKAIEKLGLKRGLIVSYSLFGFLVSLVWTVSRLHSTIWIFILLTILLVLIRTSVSGVKVALFSYMNNMVPNHIRGRVISTRQCISALAGIGAHPMAGSVFAWSLTNNNTISPDAYGFPLNFVFTFYLISIMSFAATFLTASLPDNAK